MSWVLVAAMVIGVWLLASLFAALLFGQAVRIANRRTPRRRSAVGRSPRLDRIVEIATGAIPVIRPRLLDSVTGAIPIIRPRID